MKRCYIGANWLKGVAYGEKSYKSLKSFKFRKLMKYHVISVYLTSPIPSCRRGTSYSTGSFEAYKVIVPLLQEGLGEVTIREYQCIVSLRNLNNPFVIFNTFRCKIF